MAVLQRVGVGSAFKIGAVVYALMFAVFGLIGLFCNLALIAPVMSTAFMVNGDVVSSRDLFGSMGVLTLGGLCVAYLVGIVAAAMGGGVSLALLALFYNWAVRWVGGLELDVAGPGVGAGTQVVLNDMRGGSR